MKKAIITGITGQDGSYLAELLIEKGYEVHGLVRRVSTFNRERIEHLYTDDKREKKLHLHYGDLEDYISIVNVIKKVMPDEIFNLGAQSHVAVSYETPYQTAQATGLGILNILEAIRILKLKCKIYQASTSELFSGDLKEAPQNENIPFNPVSPYGVAKLYAHKICQVYRKAYGMFICCGILFNHESPRRGENFVTRKITLGIRDILNGKQKYLYLGNLDAQRDWGYAKDYVKGMWMMLQQDKADDFVLATGKTHTVKEFCKEAFGMLNMDYKNFVRFDKKQIRPNEVDYLCGDYSKAKKVLGWQPKIKFKELVRIMVEADIKDIKL